MYGSSADTLHHIIGNEASYLTLYGVQIEGAPARGQRFDGWASLRALAVRTGEALVEQARILEPGQRLQGEFNGRAYDMAAGVPASTGRTPGSDHRSHTATILGIRGIAVPALDVWAFAEATDHLWD